MRGVLATKARGGARVAAPNTAAPGLHFPASAILSALPTPTLVLDGDNRFRFANPAAEGFFGLSAPTLASLGLADLLPEDGRLFALLAQVRTGDAPVSDHDLVLESPRLERRGVVAAHGAPFHDLPGGVVLTLHDGSTARMLGRQQDFLGAARGASAMASMLAHEIKNPLSGIRGAAQLLEHGASENDRELCQLIQDEVDRVRGLVDRMDMFSDRPVELEPVNIHQVLDHVKRVARTGFAAGLRIVEEYDPSLPLVWGNRDLLVQILLNLVKNAAEAAASEAQGATNGRGEIALATAFHHGVRIAVPGSKDRVHLPLAVSVRDDGPGIADAVRETLFEPFVSTKRGGQGLGLALVAKLVADQGGLIECDSRPGRTVFRLLLAMPPPAKGAKAGRAEAGGEGRAQR